jgi:glycerol-3-phosphate dehydrogenase
MSQTPDAAAPALSPQRREEAFAGMVSEPLDVLVIGGGVVGCGSALDAATRGLRVGLMEARDLASGTSSRSSKLIHGGLRYLEMLDFALVGEALRERDLLLQRLAPHLVRPVSFLYPLRHRAWERAYVGAGIAAYDLLGAVSRRSRGLPRHRHHTRTSALRLAPALRADALVGAVQYWDAQVDDARHTLFVARTAAAHGALVATRTRVTGLLREDERVVGVVARDLESGRELQVRARQVLNATGVWTDETLALADESGLFQVRASKGVHLVVPRDRIDSRSGIILRTETSVLFVIPWGSHWILGTTDTDWDLDKAHPAASASDIDYLLSHLNAVLNRPLTSADVQGVYAGLRPLLSGESDATSTLSREHAVGRPAPGLVLVAGGKYTTYRVMAKDAVDAVARGLTDDTGRAVPASRTDEVPLLGAVDFDACWESRAELARRHGLPGSVVEHLLGRYGTLVDEVLALVAADPSLADRLPLSADYLRAEVVYATAYEGARHLDDVLTRRTRLSIEGFDRGVAAATDVADLMGQVLGWSAAQRRSEVEHYLQRVAAERESQQMPDDETADAARLGAADVVPLS